MQTDRIQTEMEFQGLGARRVSAKFDGGLIASDAGGLVLREVDNPPRLARVFHGYCRNYGYVPLYVFCGGHVLCAKLRTSDIDAAAGAKEELKRIVAQIRARWLRAKIVVRADKGLRVPRARELEPLAARPARTRRGCVRTNCGYGFRPSPTCSSTRCANWG